MFIKEQNATGAGRGGGEGNLPLMFAPTHNLLPRAQAEQLQKRANKNHNSFVIKKNIFLCEKGLFH